MTQAQLDLLDFLTSPAARSSSAPAPAAPAESDVHWLVVTTRRAATACGEVVVTYSQAERVALVESGRRLRCNIDRFSPAISCQRCKEVL
jgi:hypothetical protein